MTWEDRHQAQAPGPRASAYRRFVFVLLMLSFTLNILDRQVITILADAIKGEFGLKDWHLGILTGVAFAVLYSFAALPIAWLADRWNRAHIIAVAVGAWSLFTMLSGAARSYGHLVLLRILIGLGEAGGTPPAHSLIADYAPKEKRASAIAFYSLGIPLGALLGLALGGLAFDALGWRMVFVLAGAPGIVLAVLIALTVRDPWRSKAPQAGGRAATPLPQALRELVSKKSFVLLSASGALKFAADYALMAFLPAFFLRCHGQALTDAADGLQAGWAIGAVGLLGLLLGATKGGSGVAGLLVGGWLTDAGAKRDLRFYIWVKAWANLARGPFLIAALLAPDLWTALTLMTIQMLLTGIANPGGYAAIQGLVRPDTRATAAAVYLMTANLVGLGLGPLLVGLTSDGLAAQGLGSAEGLRWALALCAVPVVLSSLVLLPAARWFRQETVS